MCATLFLCMCVCVCALPCLASLSFAVLVMHVTTPPCPPPLPAGCLLLTLKLLAQFSSDSTRLEARRGNISRNMSGCYFYSPSLLALLSFPLASRGREVGIREGGQASLCTLFIAHLESQRMSPCLVSHLWFICACCLPHLSLLL